MSTVLTVDPPMCIGLGLHDRVFMNVPYKQTTNPYSAADRAAVLQAVEAARHDRQLNWALMYVHGRDRRVARGLQGSEAHGRRNDVLCAVPHGMAVWSRANLCRRVAGLCSVLWHKEAERKQ